MSNDQSSASSEEIQTADDLKKEAFISLFGKDYLRGFQDPIVFRELKMYSPAVQQSYKRDFTLLSRVLFAEYIYRRRPFFNQDILNDFAQVCATKISNVLELLKKDNQRVRELCRTQGETIDASYFVCKTTLAPIIHSLALQYIKALNMLDQLQQATGSATLNGVITSDQRREFELRARKAVKAFTATVRNESAKMRKERDRLIASSQLAQEDTEVHDVNRLVDEARAAFDKEDKTEVAGDAQMEVVLSDQHTVAGSPADKPTRTSKPKGVSSPPTPEVANPEVVE